MLRKIDLSGNTLGPKAFEILAKVYSQEKPIDFVLPARLLDNSRELTSDFGGLNLLEYSKRRLQEESGRSGESKPAPSSSSVFSLADSRSQNQLTSFSS